MNTPSYPDSQDSDSHRKWNELLQEMRVMQTGVQILLCVPGCLCPSRLGLTFSTGPRR